MAMSAPQMTQATQDYTKIYWIEAFGALMDAKVNLPQERVDFYARVLISHTLANNILKDQTLSDPIHQKELTDTFYKEYQNNIVRKSLIASVFMRTLIDIDDGKLKLNSDDKSYIENVGLDGALKAKNFMHLKEDKDIKDWMVHYMYAKTPPKVIEYNVELYRRLGVEAYSRFIEQELFITSGPTAVSKEVGEIFTMGWYNLYGKKVVSLNDVRSLKEAYVDRNKLTQITNPYVGLAFFEVEILRNSLPEEVRDLYWKQKISNLTTFIEQMSMTEQIASKR